jgi:hypothetical protein
MSTNETTLTIQITDQRHRNYQRVFSGVRRADEPEFVTFHNGSYRERLHVSQFQQIAGRASEYGAYAATEDIEGLLASEGLRRALPHEGSWCIQVGETLVRVCPANLRPTPPPQEVLQDMQDRRCAVCGVAEADYLVTPPSQVALLVCGVCRDHNTDFPPGTDIVPLWHIEPQPRFDPEVHPWHYADVTPLMMCEVCGESKACEEFGERDDDFPICTDCQQHELTLPELLTVLEQVGADAELKHLAQRASSVREWYGQSPARHLVRLAVQLEVPTRIVLAALRDLCDYEAHMSTTTP